jgi:hypothetical protein
MISSIEAGNAVKNEPEDADTSNIDIEARYGEKLKMN